jgi:hypothetical protein
MLKKIISGGQTGCDQAALDVAIKRAIEHGGWCPKGRISEYGIIPEKYNLLETESHEVEQRTRRNIEESDGTLVFVPQLPLEIKDGTRLTIEYAQSLLKPLLIINLSNCDKANEEFDSWLRKHNISIVNVGGPRQSSAEEIYDKTYNKFGEMLDFAIERGNVAKPRENNIEPAGYLLAQNTSHFKSKI